MSGDYLDEVHQDIAEFAARHLDEDEVDDFVDQLLERKGYTRESRWAPPQQQQGGRQPVVRPRAGQGGSRGGGQGQQQAQRSYFKK